MRKPYEVIYEDDDIIVVDKSSSTLSIPDRYDRSRPNLRDLLNVHHRTIHVVHRLDMETSGIMVFARHASSHAHLSRQFETRSVKKVYMALCQHPMEESGTIHTQITESKSKKGIYIASKIGKEALTDYQVIKTLGRYALVLLHIHTGRTHQIRVHMKHIGAPLLTDSKYGLSDSFYLSQIKKLKFNRNATERPLLSRSSLHSYQLTVQHPTTLEQMTWEAPLHKDMKAVVYQMEKSIR